MFHKQNRCILLFVLQLSSKRIYPSSCLAVVFKTDLSFFLSCSCIQTDLSLLFCLAVVFKTDLSSFLFVLQLSSKRGAGRDIRRKKEVAVWWLFSKSSTFNILTWMTRSTTTKGCYLRSAHLIQLHRRNLINACFLPSYFCPLWNPSSLFNMTHLPN